MFLILLAACQPSPSGDKVNPDDTADASDSADSGSATDAPAWDPGADPVDCAAGGSAPLLEAALTNAGLSRDGLSYGDHEWDGYSRYVDDAFNLSWYREIHHHPEEASCFARQVQADLDAAAAAPHPVAALLGAYAPYIDATPTGAPIDPGSITLSAALTTLQAAAGSSDDPALATNLPADLQEALVPIVLALADSLTVRAALKDTAHDYVTLGRLYAGAAAMVLSGERSVPDVTNADEVAWFTAWYIDPTGPRLALTDAAHRLAFAVEDAHLERFKDQSTDWSWWTEAGVVRIAPGTNDHHVPDDGPYLFLLELGGDDVYTGPAGATANSENPVSLNVDLGGKDTYGYDPVPDPNDPPGALPSDEGGRASASGYYISVSETPRQGSAKFGIGMLFDFGGDNDTYTSLRESQGFGAMGVGVLADDGGDDVYVGEAGVQGAGVFGFGLLYDGGGNDTYTAWAYSQGFAYVGSGGLLYDHDGADTYWSDPGNSFGGTTLYYSPQLAGGEGNSSLCQAAGFGFRGDNYGLWWSGGFATLRDATGDDSYTAGVFAQATGYWQGTGLLAEGDGDDEYDALWYIQGGAAHFALAILEDGGGDDRYNPNFTPYNVSLGSGHDYSVGIAIDESGNDTYHSTTLSMGASNCQGIGVFVDVDGGDTYESGSTYGYGLGNHSTECDDASGRTSSASVGIFVDGGGDVDTYEWPDTTGRIPADNSVFGVAWAGTADEFGGAVDGDGEANFHAR